MSKPRANVVIGTCSYCGALGEVEDEHVVPQALFVNVNQATVTVPAGTAMSRKALVRTTCGTI